MLASSSTATCGHAPGLKASTSYRRHRLLIFPLPKVRLADAVRVRAEPDIFGKLKDKSYLDAAAKRFALGIEKGVEEEDIIQMELGVTPQEGLSELQLQYKDKLIEKLRARAEEIKKEEEELKARIAKNVVLGQKAYECGEYAAAVRLLEAGVQDVGPDSPVGGEAQLWLALSYQACGREQDCIDLCKSVEQNHPIRKIKKQAENLRYILEAPKLEISEDERVKIPLLQTDTWRTKERKSTGSSRVVKAKPAKTSYWDRATWDVQLNSAFIPDKWYTRVAWALVFTGMTVYLNMQASSL